MLGPPKVRDLDRPVSASVEALIPADHFYRYLDAKLDLSFVREWARDCYAASGRPSIDPVVFFKLQLIMFFEGLRSERKLMETVALNLAHRWYLGYHLDEPLPDHSSLTRICQRLGLAHFRRFFEHIVQLCLEAGLVWGEELFFDATKVRQRCHGLARTPPARGRGRPVVAGLLIRAVSWRSRHYMARMQARMSQPATTGVPGIARERDLRAVPRQYAPRVS